MTDTPDPLAGDPADLSYEQARDSLALIVRRLEDGSASLEESLRLWERGEALAQRCTEWLDDAQSRLDAATGTTAGNGQGGGGGLAESESGGADRSERRPSRDQGPQDQPPW